MLSAAAASSAGIDDLGGTKPGELPSGGKFIDADGCAQCHGGGVAGDTSYLPSDTWAGTMMANAARDPVFFAALAIANQDAPGVGTYCIRCHAPIGFVRGHATPADGSSLDKVDSQGIGCEVCHRAETSAAPNDPYFLGDAQLVFSDDTTKHGPYGSAPSPVHSSVLEPGLSDARFCGQCHQVTNPGSELRDASGAPMGIAFPLDTTFEEWRASAYGDEASGSYAGCIDCHMPRVSGDKPVATPAGAPLRKDPRRHALAGGNYWGIQAVMAANPDRAEAFPIAFENALANTLETLGKAAEVTLEGAPSTLLPGEAFEVKVRVTNLSGHKFPAGYAESRRAWVAVALVDPHDHDAEPVFLAGGYDAATGHIKEEPKTRVYRAQHGRWNGQAGEAEEHIALHDMVLSDSRIPPKGFQASITTMPLGDIDFNDGTGGYRHYDEATLSLTAPAGVTGTKVLSARVYYQSMTREYVEFLRDANTTSSHGEALYSIYQATGEAAPILIASAGVTVSFGGDGGGGGSGGGGGGGNGGGGTAGTGGGTSGSDGAEGCDCRAAGARGSDLPSLVAAAMAAGIVTSRRRRRRR
jgi:uncharacterized membrane protein YgcG